MAFDNFDVDELMASLEASSTTGYTVESRTILHPSMALDDGANLDDLLLQAEGTVPVKTIPDLEVEAPQAVQTRKAKLSRWVTPSLHHATNDSPNGRVNDHSILQNGQQDRKTRRNIWNH